MIPFASARIINTISIKILSNSLSQDIEFADMFHKIEIKAFKRPFKAYREQIPLKIAGIGPRMSNIALNESDGYLGHVVCSKEYLVNNIVPLKQNKDSHISSIILCAINKNRAQAVKDCKGTIAFYSIVKAYSEPFVQLGFGSNILQLDHAINLYDNAISNMMDSENR